MKVPLNTVTSGKLITFNNNPVSNDNAEDFVNTGKLTDLKDNVTNLKLSHWIVIKLGKLKVLKDVKVWKRICEGPENLVNTGKSILVIYPPEKLIWPSHDASEGKERFVNIADDVPPAVKIEPGSVLVKFGTLKYAIAEFKDNVPVSVVKFGKSKVVIFVPEICTPPTTRDDKFIFVVDVFRPLTFPYTRLLKFTVFAQKPIRLIEPE